MATSIWKKFSLCFDFTKQKKCERLFQTFWPSHFTLLQTFLLKYFKDLMKMLFL